MDYEYALGVTKKIKKMINKFMIKLEIDAVRFGSRTHEEYVERVLPLYKKLKGLL